MLGSSDQMTPVKRRIAPFWKLFARRHQCARIFALHVGMDATILERGFRDVLRYGELPCGRIGHDHRSIGRRYHRAWVASRRDWSIGQRARPEPLLVNGGQVVKSLSLAFLADLQQDWVEHGKNIFPVLREKFPQAYFGGLVALAKMIRWETAEAAENARPDSKH
jgi:hypothetical protein